MDTSVRGRRAGRVDADEGGWCQLCDPDQRFPPKLDELGDLESTLWAAIKELTGLSPDIKQSFAVCDVEF